MANRYLKLRVLTPPAAPITFTENYYTFSVPQAVNLAQSMRPLFLLYPTSNSSTNPIGFTLRKQPHLTTCAVSTRSKPSSLTWIPAAIKVDSFWCMVLWALANPQSCNHHHNQDTKQFHNPPRNPSVIKHFYTFKPWNPLIYILSSYKLFLSQTWCK